MAAHELTFHLWEAGFNRNPSQGEKYDQLSPSAVLHTLGHWECVLVGEACQSRSVNSCRCCSLHRTALCEASDTRACLTSRSLKAVLRGWCCTLLAQALGRGEVRVFGNVRKSVCEQGIFSPILPTYTLALTLVHSPLGSLRPL